MIWKWVRCRLDVRDMFKQHLTHAKHFVVGRFRHIGLDVDPFLNFLLHFARLLDKIFTLEQTNLFDCFSLTQIFRTFNFV